MVERDPFGYRRLKDYLLGAYCAKMIATADVRAFGVWITRLRTGFFIALSQTKRRGAHDKTATESKGKARI